MSDQPPPDPISSAALHELVDQLSTELAGGIFNATGVKWVKPVPATTERACHPHSDDGIVTRETVEIVRFLNNAVANRAVMGQVSKTEFIRWLLDENERLSLRLGHQAALAPGVFPRH